MVKRPKLFPDSRARMRLHEPVRKGDPVDSRLLREHEWWAVRSGCQRHLHLESFPEGRYQVFETAIEITFIST